jgi:hypothetical protein
MKAGLQATADYFKEKGDVVITKHYLYQGSREGILPFVKAGNRIIFDTELLEDHLKIEALRNVKRDVDNIAYGQLRKVNL